MKLKCTHPFIKHWLFSVGKEYQIVGTIEIPQGKIYRVIDNFGDVTDIHEKYFESGK